MIKKKKEKCKGRTEKRKEWENCMNCQTELDCDFTLWKMKSNSVPLEIMHLCV